MPIAVSGAQQEFNECFSSLTFYLLMSIIQTNYNWTISLQSSRCRNWGIKKPKGLLEIFWLAGGIDLILVLFLEAPQPPPPFHIICEHGNHTYHIMSAWAVHSRKHFSCLKITPKQRNSLLYSRLVSMELPLFICKWQAALILHWKAE